MAQLKAQQIASLLRNQGVAPEKIPTMTAIALAESGGRTEAFNPVGLDRSYGLFQVNMHGNLGPARMKEFGLKTEQQLFDPATNVRAAKGILNSQGLGAWSVYKSGKYKEFLPQAQQAAAQLGAQEQKSDQAASGRTIIVLGNQDEKEDPLNFLTRYRANLDSQLPEIKSQIDPTALLATAFKQQPLMS